MWRLWESIGFLGIVLLSCQPSSASQAMATPEAGLNIAPDALAVPYCPECEMRFPPHKIADTMRYEGKLYGFCSQACKRSFAQRMGVGS
jgi:YHS domain-containing protein